MIPPTAHDLITLLVSSGQTRACLDITAAAKTHRLGEADIAEIEHTIMIEIGKVRAAKEELPFDVEPPVAQAEAMLSEFFELAKKARIARNSHQAGGKR